MNLEAFQTMFKCLRVKGWSEVDFPPLLKISKWDHLQQIKSDSEQQLDLTSGIVRSKNTKF